MIESDLQQFVKDLQEEVDLFTTEDFKIRHLFKEDGRKLVNTFIFKGKSYAFGNLIPNYKNEIERKRYLKRYAKLSLYKALSSYYNKSMPWGALTGIRPTKLAYQSLKDDGEFRDFFLSTMKVSQEKTDIVERILEAQKGIYTSDVSGVDLFIFIPFCPSRCKYCSFITSDLKDKEKLVDIYVKTLIKEIEDSKKYIKNLRSIYIGGGTPVALDDNYLEEILKKVDEINTGVEFTVEAGRPDRITENNLKLLKKYRVNRICVNPQTFNDKTLKLIGRNHTAECTIEKYNLAKSMGFAINMDLICGLDGETLDDFKYTLDKTISLNPENITVHTLCVKKGSYLAEKVDRLNDGDIEQMVNYASEKLMENGYNPYYLYRQKYMAGNLENVGYTKKGYACLYNIDTMEEIASTVACGANAINKRLFDNGERIERYAPPKDVKTYLSKIDVIMQGKDKFFE